METYTAMKKIRDLGIICVREKGKADKSEITLGKLDRLYSNNMPMCWYSNMPDLANPKKRMPFGVMTKLPRNFYYDVKRGGIFGKI
eukprot:4935581-Prymnesium_polylepis.1